MSSNIILLLSENGSTLKCFMRKDEKSAYKQVITQNDVEEFKENFIVKNYPEILPQIIKSYSATTHQSVLVAIRKKQEELAEKILTRSIDYTSVAKDERKQLEELAENFKNAFLFLHENTTLHPGHHMAIANISGISGDAIDRPHRAHQETLDDLILFIEEYVLFQFKDNRRERFVRGFQYQQTRYNIVGSLYTYLSQTQDDDFTQGREAAKNLALK